MVSGTLLSEGKGAVDEIVDALGEICVGVWHGMPAHTPRDAVLDAAQEASWLTGAFSVSMFQFFGRVDLCAEYACRLKFRNMW